MATRDFFTSLSPDFDGAQYVDDIAEKGDVWFKNMTLVPTSITNSGNDYTIVIDPALPTGDDVSAGMGFYVTPNADNTGAVQMRVTAANAYYPVVRADGSDVPTGQFNSLTTYLLVFIGGAFKILSSASGGASGGSGIIDEQEFLTSGVWNKPEDISSNAIVEVWLWGGGGGAATGGGSGGGGACHVRRFKASELTDIVSVTIGAGGITSTAGGTSSFGSYMNAFGGGGGIAAVSGGGGGIYSAGGNGAGTIAGNGGDGGGGGGGAGSGNTPGKGRGGGTDGSVIVASSHLGGGSTYGGGGGHNGPGGGFAAGGSSIFGGGGGHAVVGGTSVFGGNGGTSTTAPTVPGGGGGASATLANRTGAAGKCIVKVIS